MIGTVSFCESNLCAITAQFLRECCEGIIWEAPQVCQSTFKDTRFDAIRLTIAIIKGSYVVPVWLSYILLGEDCMPPTKERHMSHSQSKLLKRGLCRG